MAFKEYERIELHDKGLLGCYDKHEALWIKMAALAYRQAVEAVTPDPEPDDVVDYLLPALRISPEFRQCKSDAGGALGAQKWYVYFADYVLKKAWDQIHEGGEEVGDSVTEGD